MNQNNINTQIVKINAELDRAVKKHPQFPIDIIHQVAIVQEEAGEAMRATLQCVYEGRAVSEVQKELIETAAMCIRVLDSIYTGRSERVNQLPTTLKDESI